MSTILLQDLQHCDSLDAFPFFSHFCRNGCSSFNNSSESNNRSYSPVEGVDHELSKLQESSSLNNTDSYSDSQDDNKDHTCLNKSDDDKCNDDDDRNLLDGEEMQVLAISSACDYDRRSDNDDDDDNDFDGERYVSKESIKAKTRLSEINLLHSLFLLS